MSNITLTHDFATYHGSALSTMLKGTISIDQYLSKLRKYAKTCRDVLTPEGELDKNQLKVIGDGFEIFGEAFIKLSGSLDDRIFIKDYKLLSISDNGVDAEGICTKTDRRVFIQFKCYRETEFLTGGAIGHLDSFQAEVFQMLQDENEMPKEWPRTIVITTAKGIHEYTKDVKYRGRVECFPIDSLKQLTNNPEFWKQFSELLE